MDDVYWRNIANNSHYCDAGSNYCCKYNNDADDHHSIVTPPIIVTTVAADLPNQQNPPTRYNAKFVIN